MKPKEVIEYDQYCRFITTPLVYTNILKIEQASKDQVCPWKDKMHTTGQDEHRIAKLDNWEVTKIA